jgi:hypothetical protein
MYNNDPKYTNPSQAGLGSLVASPYADSDVMRVKMTPREVAGLQQLAMAYGANEQDLYDPVTGEPQFSFLKKILPMIAGAILPSIPVIGPALAGVAKTIGFGNQAIGTGLLVGGVTGLIEGDLKKGLMAGIGAYSGANLAQALQGASVGAGIEPEKISAEELAKTNQAIEAAKQTVGAKPVYNPTGDAEKVGIDFFQSANKFKGTPTVGDLDIGRQAIATGATTPDQILDFTKSANAFRTPITDAAKKITGYNALQGTPTAADLAEGRAANIAGTGMRGVGEGITSLFKSPQARSTFMDRLGGGFKSPFMQSLSRNATFMGVMDAFTPEYEMPSSDYGDDTVYIPGDFNPMYGYGREHGYFLPGKYYKKTKKGLVPYNPYAMAAGYAGGGQVQAPNQDMNLPMPYPHPNQNYPLSTVVKANYSPQYISNVPQPREVLSGYDTKVDPFTGEERFAEGGPVFGGQVVIPAIKDGVEGYYTDTTRTTFVPRPGVMPKDGAAPPNQGQPPVGVAPPKGPPLAQPTNPLPPQPPVGPPPVILPPENPFDPARQRYMDMVNAPPPAPVDTKPTMDYLDELSHRAKNPEFMAFTTPVKSPYVPPPPGGGGSTTGGDTTTTTTGGGTAGESLQQSLLINKIGMPAFQALVKAGQMGGAEGVSAALQRMPTEYADAFKKWALTDPSKGFSVGNLRAGMDFSSLGTPTGAATAALGAYNTAKAIEKGKEGRAAFNAAMTAAQFGGPVTALAAAAIAAIGASLVNTKEYGDVALRNYWNAVDKGRGLGVAPPEELAQGFINFYRTNKNEFAGQEKYGRTGNEDFVYDMTQVINNAVKNGVVSKDADANVMYRQVVQPWLNSMGSGPQNEDARRIQDFMMTDLIHNFMQGKPISNAQVKGDKKFKIVSERPVYAGAAPVTTQQDNTQNTGPSMDPAALADFMQAQNPYGDTMRFADGGAIGEDYNFGFAAGGLGSLPEYKAGGKLLDGPGDGMSDDIPAVIRGKGVQRAALADGEFVIPADVVSHLGNGSTKAGAKKLYQMMAQIRKARTGKTKQAPAVKTDRFLPA